MQKLYDGLSPETTDPNDIEEDYDPTETEEYQDGFEDGIEEERAKWLPLWEAVKDLMRFDDFSRDDPTRFNTYGGNQKEYFEKFKNMADMDKHSIRLARRELYRVALELRNQGEK